MRAPPFTTLSEVDLPGAHAWRKPSKSTLRRALLGHRSVDRQHADRRAPPPRAPARNAELPEARGPQPDRLGQGPRRQVDDRVRGSRRSDRAWTDDPRTHLREHGNL